MTESQSGAFSIDNVLIGSSASNTKSTYNDTYVIYCISNYICDRICEKGSYTRIQFFNFKEA